jgi:hypothetical protein
MSNQSMLMLVITIGVSVATGLIKALDPKNPLIPINLSAKWRVFIAAVLGVVVAAGTGITTPSDFTTSLVAGFVTAIPTLILELFEALKDSKSSANVVLPIALALCAIQTYGCATLGTVSSVLADVAVVSQDAITIIDAIQNIADAFFVERPNADAQKKVNIAIRKCRLAVDGALRLARGTVDLDSHAADAAFGEFRQAYADLVELLGESGVLSGKSFAGAKGVPIPMAVSGGL